MKLVNIRKVYHNKNNEVEALKGISLELMDKGITVLLGSSGSGKSTLLNILSGQDKDFEGQLLEVPQLDYITQDFRLFESMSVLDNLLIVSNDLDLIQSFLRDFSMEEHAHKKVSKCSNGQKKRVQFIRALLQSPGLLLCDEPTAALDHENANLLMKQLKEISKDVQVFLVTHDIALAQEYADHVIEMQAGKIINDETVHQLSIANEGLSKVKKSLSDTFSVVLKKIKSRIPETVFMFAIALFLSVSMFVCTQIFTNVDSQTRLFTMWENSANLVTSKPNEDNRIDEKEGGVSYTDYDRYSHSSIQEKIEKYPNLIAYEAFFDSNRIRSTIHLMSPTTEQLSTFQTEKAYINVNRSEEMTYLEGVISKDPGGLPVFVDEEYMQELFKQYIDLHVEASKTAGLTHTKSEVHYFDSSTNEYITRYFSLDELETNKDFYTYFENLFGNGNLSVSYDGSFDGLDFHPYTIVNEKAIPLVQGTYPKSKNEVLVNYDTAQLIKTHYGFNSLEDLVNKKIQVALPVYAAGLMIPWEESPALTYIDLTISGITPLNNKNERQVFFMEGAVHEVLLQDRLLENSDVIYNTLSFIFDVNTNFDQISIDLNNDFSSSESQFVLGANLEAEEAVSYRDPKLFMMYSGFALLGILFILILYYVFNRKRMNKESGILKTYQYSIMKESIIRMVFVYLAVFLFFILFGQFMVQLLNEFAQSLRYGSFLSFNVLWIIVCVGVSYLVHTLFDIFIGGRTS